MENTESSWVLILVPILLLYAFGVWMGFNKKIVVFRNYNDIFVVGLLFIIPIGFLTLFSFVGEDASDIKGAVLYACVILEFITLVFIIIRTWKDNKNPLKLLFALFIKIPIGIFFFFHIYGAFTNKTRTSRGSSMFWSLMMLPLIYGLVADKSTGKMPSMSKR